MKVLRDAQIISGFIYEQPVAELRSLTHCGEALCCRGHSRPPHSHKGFEFLYLSRGEASWTTGGKVYHQRPGEIFVAFPREPHATGLRANAENQHIWIGLQLDHLGPIGAALGQRLRQAGTRLLKDCREAEPLLHAIIAQVVTMRPARLQVIRGLVNAFILMIGQQLSVGGRPTATGKVILPYSAAIQRSLGLMRQNLDRRLPLLELTIASGLRSAPHFCSRFRRDVGVTPAAYHLNLRLEAAREALALPSFSITQAALQFGFSSSQHFSTLFKRAFGRSPRSWKVSGLAKGSIEQGAV